MKCNVSIIYSEIQENASKISVPVNIHSIPTHTHTHTRIHT